MKISSEIFEKDELVVIPLDGTHLGIGGIREYEREKVDKNKKTVNLVSFSYEAIDDIIKTLEKFKKAKIKIDKEKKKKV